jgi:hypothetical protein
MRSIQKCHIYNIFVPKLKCHDILISADLQFLHFEQQRVTQHAIKFNTP